MSQDEYQPSPAVAKQLQDAKNILTDPLHCIRAGRAEKEREAKLLEKRLVLCDIEIALFNKRNMRYVETKKEP